MKLEGKITRNSGDRRIVFIELQRKIGVPIIQILDRNYEAFIHEVTNLGS